MSVYNGITHWDRVTHICASKLIIIGSGTGLSPGRRQAIIWTNNGILLIRTLGINFSEIFSKIQTFSFQTNNLKISSAKWRQFCQCIKGNCMTAHWVLFWYKDSLFWSMYFYYEDTTVVRPPYLYLGNPFAGKTTFLNWKAHLFFSCTTFRIKNASKTGVSCITGKIFSAVL